jgi:ankyrin repeat protein
MVDLLLAHGAIQANPYDTFGLTPFSLAVENGHKTTAQRLLANLSVKTSVVRRYQMLPDHLLTYELC